MDRHSCPGCNEETYGERCGMCGMREYCDDCQDTYQYVKEYDDGSGRQVCTARICPDCDYGDYIERERGRPDVVNVES